MTSSQPPRTFAPATTNINNLSTLFLRGRFSPASVQRGYEWSIEESRQLLNDIEKVFALTHPENDDPDEPVDGELDEEEEDLSEDELFFKRIDDLQNQVEELTRATQNAALVGTATTDDADDSLLQSLDEEQPEVEADEPFDSYFIGNVILVERRAGEFEIFDGLQRFTTLTILFAVLRDLLDDEITSGDLNEIINRQIGPCLSARELDKGLEEHILPAGATLAKRNLQGNPHAVLRRILQVKNTYIDRIETWTPERQNQFARFLLEQVWVTALLVEDERMARQMFVSTNRHGKKLDLIDLLRAQLAEAYDRLPDEDASGIFTEKWTMIGLHAGHQLEDYLRAFDMLERRQRQHDSWPTDLGAHVLEHYHGDRLKRFLNRLVAHSWAWEKLQNILYHGGKDETEQDVWRLHVYRWPQWRGLVLRWWGQYSFELRQETPNEARLKLLRSKLKRLHKRCMALTLARLSESDLEKIFNKAIDMDARGGDVFATVLSPNQRQRQQIDKTLTTQIRDLETWWPLMRWIEISRWRKGLPRLIRDSNTEHVWPRRPDLRDLGDASLMEYEDSCYSLGNLAVISKEAHKQITNESFAEKLPVLREEAGKFITMQSVVHDEQGHNRRKWNRNVVRTRAAALRKEIWRLMGLKAPKAPQAVKPSKKAGKGSKRKPAYVNRQPLPNGNV